MKREIITTGKTVEEATAAAARELGVACEEITVEVLEEPKKGLFGIGAAPAKIKAVYVLSSADMALDFVKNLVKDMELNVTVEMREDADRDGMLIDIQGEGAGSLIGHHGDTLDSIQYLANLAANKKVDGEKRAHVRITVDAENYRAKREMALRALARKMAEKVLKYKRSVMLEPMNPYERRIIHSEIQGIEGVATNSIGSENNRKIVIYLEDKKSSAKTGDGEEY